MSGWIKVHRQLTEWEWYDDINTFRVFMHLLLTCNHEKKNWHGMDILPGQVVISVAKLSQKVGLTPKATRLALERLKSTGETASTTSNKYTIITITNWESFQSEGKQRANKGQARGQTKGKPEGKQRASRSASLSANQRAIGGQAKGKQRANQRASQRATTKEGKKIRNKEVCPKSFDDFWTIYPRREKKKEAKALYQKIIQSGVNENTLIEGAKKYALATANTEKEFIRLPTTWLRGEGWEDEIASKPQKKAYNVWKN